MGRLDGKVAIVTGAAIGIGPYYARGLAAEGAKVAIIDLEPAEKIVAEIKAAGGTAMSMIGDVSDRAAVGKFVGAVEEAYGGIHILINNAGLARMARILLTELSTEEWDRYFAVNVRGMFLCVQAVVPIMKRQNYGKIVNISSGSAYKGIPHMLHYVTSKGAIVAFTRALSRELGEFGIAVNTLAPGLILSDTGVENTAHHDEMRSPVRASRAFKRDAYPEDLLGALVFLASSDSDFITGQTIAVDGGSINT
jgi:NAD(P)-dependent dehydrogenase (short-subunit alcohol dehydrogenase family)